MDITSLKQQATTIRDEQERSANSATRVGRAMLETIEAIEESANNIATNAANIDKANANIATNAANIDKANANIATNKAHIADLQAFYHGDLGNYASWTEAQTRLDAMPTDGSTSGQYQIRVGGVPFVVIHIIANSASKIFTQTVIGSAFINSQTGTLQTAYNVASNLFSRSYAEGQWGQWVRLAQKSEVPTAQTGVAGTPQNYVYQDITDPTRYVMSGVGKLFQYNGGLKLRLKVWGTGNKQFDDGKYSTYDCPVVTTASDGAMDHFVHARVVNNSIYEGASTQESVKINYTNFGSSGYKTLGITKATTAKAGCMTVAHVNALNSLTSHLVDLGDFSDEEEALRKFGQLGVCNDRNLVHAHLTYTADDGTSKSTLILIQSIDRDYCRQFIFNKGRVYTRGIIFTDNTLTGISFIEDWTFMFADRLSWSAEKHGYLMSQFGTSYGAAYCDSIPLATDEADGLMSKEDHQLLYKIKAQLGL